MRHNNHPKGEKENCDQLHESKEAKIEDKLRRKKCK